MITYDANGNTLTKANSAGTTTYGWDFENRLTSVTLPNGGGTVSYRYDPLGRRIQKSGPSGTTNYVYDGVNTLEELDGSGAVLARYTEDPRTADAQFAMVRSGVTSYYNSDGINSTTSLTNAAGSLTQTYTFDSFGRTTAATGSITNSFQYAGREFDPETGLLYMRARYYDPAGGRFLSEDPAQSSWNFYAYVGNSPTRYIDPAGLVQIDYNVNYHHIGFWDSAWEAGVVRPHYKWHGNCTKQSCRPEKWKLNLTLSITFDMTYSSDSNRKHEQGHVDVAEAFFNKNKSHYEQFERIFPSKAECEKYRRSQLDSLVNGQLKTDQPQLDKAQENYDGFWGFVFNHLF